MGKVDDNKRQKRERLLNKAYELFTTKGFTNTSISDIVENADVAKGTFYLYFKDKYDLKDKLVEYKTQELFLDANSSLIKENIIGLEKQLIFIIDFIVEKLRNDKGLLRLISKNLIMGALRQTLISSEKTDNVVYNNFLKLVETDEYEYTDIDVYFLERIRYYNNLAKKGNFRTFLHGWLNRIFALIDFVNKL